MPTNTDHIVSSYTDELTALAQLIAEMGGQVEVAIENGTKALLKLDRELADVTIIADQRIDDMQRRIDDMAVSMIARRQPMASDLRAIVTAIHVASDLERVGDMAKQLARRSLKLEGLSLQPTFYNGVEQHDQSGAAPDQGRAGRLCQPRPGCAIEVCNRDDEVDAMHTSLFRELLTYMMEDPRNITQCTHLLFCAKSLERVGDHATNIAERAYYLQTGKQLTLRMRPDQGDEPGCVTADRSYPKADRLGNADPTLEYPCPQRYWSSRTRKICSILLRYNLEAEGFRVLTAETGDEAQERIQDKLPDLILLDWMLPEVSGIELCRRWRAREETARVPIIMITARGEEEERVRGLATGADDYVVKPFSVPELLARIHALLRRANPQPGDRRAQGRRSRTRPHHPSRPPRHPRRASGTDGIPPARISDAPSRPGLFARAIARWRLGQ